jgi:hypothetical protein
MGFYLNPPVELPENPTREQQIMAAHKKSDWCAENGVELKSLPDWHEIPKDCCVIFVVNSGLSEAAAIAYKKSEYDHFQRPDELNGRPVRHFLIEKIVAIKYSNITLEDFQS